jgi:hypothetical protein
MDSKLVVGLAALLLGSSAGLAADYHRDSIGPSVNSNVIRLSDCDDGVVGQTVPALLCGTGGVGAIIALDGSAGNGEADLNPAIAVAGTCKVQQTSAIGPSGGGFSFTCGVDRDDDTFVTNVDPTSTSGQGYDDDFFNSPAVAGGAQGSVDVCFREDLDGSFDDAAVFIAANVDPAGPAAGTFSIDLSLASGGADCVTSEEPVPVGLCSQTYDHGAVTTQPCPADLCGLNQGFVGVDAAGPAGGAAPVGALICHDASHQTTGIIETSGGAFDAAGHWTAQRFGPINPGTHPHCVLTSVGAADFAHVECGKV